MPWIWTLSEGKNPNFPWPAMLVAACHVIQLFCTSPLNINQATKTLIEPAIYVTFAHTFLMDLLWHRLWHANQSFDALNLVRMTSFSAPEIWLWVIINTAKISTKLCEALWRYCRRIKNWLYRHLSNRMSVSSIVAQSWHMQGNW